MFLLYKTNTLVSDWRYFIQNHSPPRQQSVPLLFTLVIQTVSTRFWRINSLSLTLRGLCPKTLPFVLGNVDSPSPLFRLFFHLFFWVLDIPILFFEPPFTTQDVWERKRRLRFDSYLICEKSLRNHVHLRNKTSISLI